MPEPRPIHWPGGVRRLCLAGSVVLATVVHVTIARDGTALTDRSFRPTYTTSQPNGPGCEPVCRQARDRLDVP